MEKYIKGCWTQAWKRAQPQEPALESSLTQNLLIMKFFSLLTAASAALATESGLNVRLEYAGGTSVKVIATNNGQETLKLLNLGTLFDDHSPVRKVSAEYASK